MKNKALLFSALLVSLTVLAYSQMYKDKDKKNAQAAETKTESAKVTAPVPDKTASPVSSQETPSAAPAAVTDKKEPVAPASPVTPPAPVAKTTELPSISKELSKPSDKEIDISLEPSTIRLTGTPGQSQEAKIRVYNSGTKDMKVSTEVNDMTNQIGKDGVLTRIYVPAGSSKASLGKWIILSDKDFVVPAHSVKEVSAVVSPPADLVGGASSVIFFRSMGVVQPEDKPTGKPRTTVMIQPRLGVLVFFETEGTVKRSGHLVGDMQYQAPAADRPFKISYEFENDGNTDILLTGTFHILDKNNALVAKENLSPVRTFPGDKGRSETEWNGGLEPGPYHVVVTLELGPDAQETIVREYDFLAG